MAYRERRNVGDITDGFFSLHRYTAGLMWQVRLHASETVFFPKHFFRVQFLPLTDQIRG